MTCVEQRTRLEERGIETDSFNDVFGAWHVTCVLHRCSLRKLSLQTALKQRPIASIRRACPLLAPRLNNGR
jgi:hypothetical protein